MRELDDSLTFTVTYEERDTPVAADEVLSGGTALGEGFSASVECTAAFTVWNTVYGGSGLLTAAHCDDDLNYETRRILTFQGHARATYTDAQWHSSSESVWNQFIYTNAGGLQRRYVYSTATPLVNIVVCVYGTITGRHCQTVVATMLSVTIGGYRSDNLVAVDQYVTDNGDSGGPWYYRNAAEGVHKGGMTYNNAYRSIFTTVTRVQQFTDLPVLTG